MALVPGEFPAEDDVAALAVGAMTGGGIGWSRRRNPSAKGPVALITARAATANSRPDSRVVQAGAGDAPEAILGASRRQGSN